VQTTGIYIAEEDGTLIGEIPSVPEGASAVMQVDPGAIDPSQSFQQMWIVGEGTDADADGDIPLPPGMEVFCGDLLECEYHGWTGLTAVSIRLDDTLVSSYIVSPSFNTGILSYLGDAGAPSGVEDITSVRLTFANIPRFDIDAIQVFAVPEPATGGLLFVFASAIAIAMFARRSLGRN